MSTDFESPSPREAQDLERVIEQMRRMMQAQYEQGGGRLMRRDVHQKMHALVRAEFIVEPHLPEALRVGLFAKPATYPAWIRFSNSANGIKPDLEPDIRGMAIKVMGVPGRKLLESDPEAPTQDFIVISAERFPVSTVGQFHGLAGAVIGNLFDKLVYFLTHPRTLWGILSTFGTHANPLQVRYFSAVPYLFGERAVKYCATPRFFKPSLLPPDLHANFLRDAARQQLAEGPAWFDFCVQFQRPGWSIEDGRALWSERESPFVKLATIRIPAERFDTPERDALGEQLSFTPWHSLPEHRPLGNLNRGRKAIYEILSALRHQTNRAPRKEPQGWEST